MQSNADLTRGTPVSGVSSGAKPDTDVDPDTAAVRECGLAAAAASTELASADDTIITAALMAMASLVESEQHTVLAANEADIESSQKAGMADALVDRLRLTPERLVDMARQLRILADAPMPPRDRRVRDLEDRLVLLERRRPVGVIGANYEARPNVTMDVASQLLKSRNAGVLRTGSAAIRSSESIMDNVVAPGLRAAGLNPAALRLVRRPGHGTAQALVAQPSLIPLVILRGSGQSTRALTRRGAEFGVRTLAHADGGGVLYIDRSADQKAALDLIGGSVDRLGVCNRLNLLLIHSEIYQEFWPQVKTLLGQLGIEASLPPHQHPRGYEWALDTGHEATVTVDAVAGPVEAAQVANAETSGLAAGICTSDKAAAQSFMDTYAGTGVFWNASTRLLDGFKLLQLPETGINVDHVPGPRGPVTFQDLYIRQFVVVPA